MDLFRRQFAANLNAICDRIGLPKSGAGRATDLARLFGMSVPSAHKWLTGGSLPDVNKIPRICNVLKCTADELILGVRTTDDASCDRFIRIPVELCRSGVDAEMMVQSECLIPFGVGPFRLLQAVSNEMEPYVMEGDFVFYDTSFTSLDRNGVYVIQHRHSGNKFIRRVQLSMNGHISLLCDSTHFSAEKLCTDCDGKGCQKDLDFLTLGLVIARILVKR